MIRAKKEKQKVKKSMSVCLDTHIYIKFQAARPKLTGIDLSTTLAHSGDLRQHHSAHDP